MSSNAASVARRVLSRRQAPPTLFAGISDVAPLTGSLCGGTLLTIHGTGFSTNSLENRVLVGDTDCRIVASSSAEILCEVQQRFVQVVNNDQAVVQPVSVLVTGVPAQRSGQFQYTFSVNSTPIIGSFEPTVGHGGELISFEGTGLRGNVAVTVGSQPCNIHQAGDAIMSCEPAPQEAGIVDIAIYVGPTRGFACPGPDLPSLRFTFTLALQSARRIFKTSATSEGVNSNDARIVKGSQGDDELVIVGQGFGSSTRFTLCEGSVACDRVTPVMPESAILHAGESSYQKLTCVPGSVVQHGASRTCDLTAESANGVLKASIPEAWTYVS